MEQPTCDQRIDASLSSRLEDIKTLWTSYCEGEDDHPELGNIWEYGLSFDYVPIDTFKDQERDYFRWQLSWGGPSSEFRFYTDYQGHCSCVEYWFLDWFDGSSRCLTGEDKELILEIWECLKECGSVEAEYQKAMKA